LLPFLRFSPGCPSVRRFDLGLHASFLIHIYARGPLEREDERQEMEKKGPEFLGRPTAPPFVERDMLASDETEGCKKGEGNLTLLRGSAASRDSRCG